MFEFPSSVCSNPCVPRWSFKPATEHSARRSRPPGRAFRLRANTCNRWESSICFSLSLWRSHVYVPVCAIPLESQTRAYVASEKQTAQRGNKPVDAVTISPIAPHLSGFNSRGWWMSTLTKWVEIRDQKAKTAATLLPPSFYLNLYRGAKLRIKRQMCLLFLTPNLSCIFSYTSPKMSRSAYHSACFCVTSFFVASLSISQD